MYGNLQASVGRAVTREERKEGRRVARIDSCKVRVEST